MPPAILNDSEDEGDNVVFDDDVHGSLSRSSGEEPAGIPSLDGTRDSDQSTGSTERLKRQLYDAHRSLCVDSGEQAQSSLGNSAAQASPSIQISKRRHTVITSGAAVSYSPEKVERTKTLKTYPSKRSYSSAAKAWSPAHREDLLDLKTSQSAKFSEHSGMQPSSDLPLGSIQANFINHEPAVMFRESGSTVPDNESSIERMIEEAIHSKGAKSTSTVKLLDSDEHHKSSSFLWSASEQTDSAKSPQSRKLTASADLNQAQEANDSELMKVMSASGESGNENIVATAGDEVHHQPETANTSLAATEKPKSSPVVRINVSELPTISTTPHTFPSPEKSSRGRKRRSQQEPSEPLSSEDIAVGLPREQYQPRPSRRRTTQMLEEPVDYSIAPEKAAKKRRKTAGASFEAPTEPGVDAITPDTAPVARTGRLQRVKKPTVHERATNVPKDSISLSERNFDSEPGKTSTQTSDLVVTEGHTDDVKDLHVFDVSKLAKQVPQPSSQLRSDDNIFLKPAPKLKSASKSKRSHTTIFEDHVDFTGNERSPSLSQQQANRKSALKDVKNEQSPAKPPVKSRRGTKHVLPSDDEDEEDELAFHPSEDEADEPPKKRGRGRPPKASVKTTVKAPEVTSETEDAPKDDTEPAVPDEPTKKRGRGRPPKAIAPSVADAEQEDTAKEPVIVKPSITTETGRDTPAKQSSAAEMPTPSPDPQNIAKEVATPPKPAKTGPTAHSPIKNSSIVPHRVGLSKRSRIPSLLKVMRPPPKR